MSLNGPTSSNDAYHLRHSIGGIDQSNTIDDNQHNNNNNESCNDSDRTVSTSNLTGVNSLNTLNTQIGAVINSNNSSNAFNSSYTQMSKDLIFNAENKSRLCLLRTCVSLIPRILPLFKENELVEILTRLTIHLDDELKIIAFQTLKAFVSDYPQWRRYVFTGFTNFILKEISDMYPKLIENALKMLIQLLNTWKWSLNSVLSKNKDSGNGNNNNSLVMLDDCCQIIYHLEGFSLFTLCHSQVQRRRFALIILKECKQIGELVKCFRCFPHHNYAIDVLDLASIFAMKQLHLQCFNSNLIVNNLKPDLNYLIEQSANWETSVNTANFNSNNSYGDSVNILF
jgi:hypothetical protein